MAESNPYQTPSSPVNSPAEQYGEIKLFSFSGRLGRLRYIAYSFSLSLILAALMAFLGGLIDGNIEAASTPGTVSYNLSLVFGLVTMFFWAGWIAQRLHDCNVSAWWGFLLLVPLANLILAVFLWVKSGTPAPNRFGNPPPPNSPGVKIVAFFVIVLALLGIIFFLSFIGLRLTHLAGGA